jgi:hypothetical protein
VEETGLCPSPSASKCGRTLSAFGRLFSEMEVVDHTRTPSPIAIGGAVIDDIMLGDLTGGAVRFGYTNATTTRAWRIDFESTPLLDVLKYQPPQAVNGVAVAATSKA